MSNRSYLYVKTPNSEEFEGLSEWAYEIPLSHILMVSGNCTKVKSHIWESDDPLALCGDFDAGYKNFFEFLDNCHQQGVLSDETFKQLSSDSHEFLDKYLGKNAKVFLEVVEIFELDDPDDFEDFDESEYEDEETAFFIYMLDDLYKNNVLNKTYLKDSLNQLKNFKEQSQDDAIDEALGIEWDDVLYYD